MSVSSDGLISDRHELGGLLGSGASASVYVPLFLLAGLLVADQVTSLLPNLL
jgi:hypothetical protein